MTVWIFATFLCGVYVGMRLVVWCQRRGWFKVYGCPDCDQDDVRQWPPVSR